MHKEMVTIQKQGVLWKTTPEYRFLIDALDRSLSEVEQKNVIKSSSIRRVVTLKIPKEQETFEIFVKHHRLSWKETLKDLLHISKARHEWKRTHQIADLGIQTVPPLAIGEKREWGFLRESYFVSKRIPSCETLHDFVLREKEKKHSSSFLAWKRKLISDVAVLIAKIHKKGIDHRDLHAGNILIEWGGERYQLRLLDLDRAHIQSHLSFRRRVFELAQFNMFFTLFVSRADRLRFFKEYYSYDPTPWHGYQTGARWVEQKTVRMVNRLYHRRDKMSLRNNKHFSRFCFPPYTGFYRKEEMAQPLLQALKNPETFLNLSNAQPLKKASEKTVRRYPLKLNGKEVDVVVKSYQTADLLGKIKNLFRSSRAKKSWIAANALYQRKIPTATPFACLLKKKWGILQESYFISEYLPKALPLVLYLQDRFAPPISPQERKIKRQLIVQFARFVRRIHELLVYHGDFKASNVLIEEKEPGAFRFYLIDLDYVKICCTLNRFQRYRNLMQLNKSFLDRKTLSMTDRLTFLKTYLGTDARNPRTLHRVWTRVTHLTTRRLKKTAKSFSH